jgi:hypothetical protein
MDQKVLWKVTPLVVPAQTFVSIVTGRWRLDAWFFCAEMSVVRAPSWCSCLPPCHQMNPLFFKMPERYGSRINFEIHFWKKLLEAFKGAT